MPLLKAAFVHSEIIKSFYLLLGLIHLNEKKIRQVIASGSLQLGGHEAYSEISENYEGDCLVKCDLTDKVIACVPNRDEAFTIAHFCILPEGGYGAVVVVPADGQALTHKNFSDWLC